MKNTLSYLYSLTPIKTGQYGCIKSISFAIDFISIAGDWAEFGVGNGVSTKSLIKHLPNNDTELYLFDSFKGLPEDWKEFSNEHVKGTFAVERIPSFDNPRVKLVVGWFHDTLPYFTTDKPFSFIHIDCDLYSSTTCIFKNINHLIVSGTTIVFDEYYNYGGDKWLNHEYKAFTEYVSGNKIKFEYLGRTDKYQVIVKIL